MAEGGIFIDMLMRLNMASVDRVLKDVNAVAREAGAKSGRSFSEGFNLDPVKTQFAELSRASELAYRDMQRGLADLQIQEARINDLRARNFKASTDAMIAAQRDLDAAIANSQRLMEEANSRAAEQRAGMVPLRDRGSDRGNDRGRGQIIPMGRGANMLGAGAAFGVAGGAIESARVAGTVQRNTQQVMAFHQDARHTQGYIDRQTQGIYQMSTQVPYSPQELSRVYQDIENHGYTGQSALEVLSTAAKTAVSTGADLKDTTDGLMTSVKDFGVQAELQSDNLDSFKKGLGDLNQMAGQLVGTFGQLKGVNPDEFFRSLGSVEPTAMKYMANLSGPQASAQVNSALSLLAQVGIGPEQGSHNISRIMAQMGSIPPGSKLYNMLGQLGVKPEDIVTAERDKGIFQPLQMIQSAIAGRTNSAGMVNIGWRYNNEQVSELEGQGYDNLSAEGKAFVDAHPEIKQGLASKMSLRKALKGTDLPASEIGDISTLAQWYSMSNGPNKFTKQGEPTEVTPGQVYQILFGTGDIARTGAILGNSAQEGQQVADQLTQVGGDALKNAFKDMMGTLPEQWKQFGASLQSLAGQMGQHMLPALTHFVQNLNGVADWLDKHQGAEEEIVNVLTTVAEAWGAAKLINAADSITGAFSKLRDSVSGVANSSGKLAEAEDEATASVKEKSSGGGLLGGKGRGALGMAGMLGTSMLMPEGTGLPGEGVLNSAAALSWLFGPEVGAPVTITIGTAELIAGIVNAPGGLSPQYQAGEGPYSQHDYYPPGARDSQTRMQGAPPDKIDHPGNLGGLLGANPSAAPSTPAPSTPAPPTGAGSNWYSGILPGAARGGVIGYSGGTGAVDPFSQPLMSVPDLHRDSVLGMLPSGMPVGLRGGEGILTPEAVQKLGGKRGIDALNNPWADPFKVGATFYGSFANGVAKYSPFGKYLKATSQTIDSLQKEFDQSSDIHQTHGRRGLPAEIEQMLASGMSPQDVMQTLGVHPGKRGGLELPSGQYLSNKDRAELGLPPGKSRGGNASWFSNEETVHSVFSKYFPESEWPAYRNLEMHEAGFNPNAKNPSGAYGIGQFMPYTWGQYGTTGKTSDLATQAEDQMKYIAGRYGTPGAAWGQYFNHPGGEGSYSRGGIVGYDLGGNIPLSPPVGPTPAPPPNITDQAQSHGIAPQDAGPVAPGGIAKAAPSTPPNGGAAPAPAPKVQGPKVGPSTQRAPVHPEDDNRKYADNKPPAALTPQGDKPGDYSHADQDRNIHANPSRQGGTENTSKGFGVGGGIIGAAEGAAAAAGNMFAPGSGQAAQIGFALANRAIGYGGQLVGIGLEGLMETFLPNDSQLGDPTNNIFGKVALGIAGAHPSPKNMAGSSALQLKPKQDLDEGAAQGKQVMPAVHMDHPTIHNYSGDHKETGDAIMKAAFGLPVGGQP